MSKELIDSHVSLAQCKKAVEALHSHELKKKEKFEETQLLPGKEQHVWLNVTVKTIPTGHRLKPVKIPIAHPLVDPRTSSVCLITKDPQREYKDLLEKHNIKFISRVVGLEKLKGKFKPYEARRMLLKENGMFLADERVIPLLPKLLGSKWFEAKKQPIPVNLLRKDLKGELERAISSTYMNQNQGTCTSIKVGKMSQKPSQIVDNIKTALPAIAKAIKGEWSNIQSLNIKTNSSVSLPIWSCSLDDSEGGRWNGLQAEDEDEAMEGESEESEEEVEPKKSEKASAAKGRKRASESDEEEEKPKKKAKAAEATKATKDVKPAKTSPATDASSKKSKATVTETPAPSATPAPNGKKAAKTKAVTPMTESTSKVVAAVPEPEKKKKSQKSVSASPSSSTPATTETSKKKKATTVDATASIKKVDSSPSTAVSESPSVPSVPKEKAGKEKKKSKVPESPVVPEKPAKSTLTKEEMKQKRSTLTGEKKKDAVVKSKGAKSAKNALLGRKAGQE
ncbi:hypothetical protein D9613_005717 [Agrocybe pediades]|uniref:Ribosomal protein L1 n=1 Tax=Agrocybe pediades TaxID=84607 RepID=A0A8H4QU19_9AGAR|nr:hypothetical protein D9613_005717 [Agrocybe pediades]